MPAAARRVFGERIDGARRYVELLATAGIERGLIGPAETGRLWDRHLLNCAVVEALIPAGARVIDAGSGAGLPGIPIALARPDLTMQLVESLTRRIAFLVECVDTLGLANTEAFKSRLEDGQLRRRLGGVDVVTARAVAPLDRLARWCLPLLRPGGRLLAIKGASASTELRRHEAVLARYGAVEATIRRCGAGVVVPETTVVDVAVGPVAERPAGRSR